MSNSGMRIIARAAVYSDKHELYESRFFYTREGMSLTLTKWLEDYPDGFFIQIAPHTGHDKKIQPKEEENGLEQSAPQTPE